MKNKVIIFCIVSLFLFTPLISSAYIIRPANLTVIVNTQGQDQSFNFHLKELGYEYNEETGEDIPVWKDSVNFTVQTENLTGSHSEIIWPFKYMLEQENTSGLVLDNISCASDVSGDHVWHQSNSVILEPNEFENIICVFNNVQEINKNPILIVPGLTGTEMFENSEKLWLDLARNFTDIGDQFMDPMQFNYNLTPTDDLNIGSVISRETVNVGVGNITVYDYTFGLMQEFINQGYAENESLFTFPYDWRYGVSGEYSDEKTNSDLLGEKINDILQQTGSSEVDVVAHSMGGLIVKKYVMDHPTDNHIGKAVFVGVPNTGAPKSVKVLLQGDNFGVLGLNDSEIKKIAENMPASYDLLPSQQYYNVKGDSFLQVVERTDLFNTSVKDLNYDESKSFLTTDHSLNYLALTGAENLHTQDFDNYDLRTAGVDVYAIDGCKAGTLGKITEVRFKDLLGNSHITYEKPEQVPGDGTVPLESATNLPISQSNKYYALTADHGKMLSQDGIRQEIVNLISGSSLGIGDNKITQDIGQCQLNGKAISVFSPINIFVTDQNGSKLGLAEDESIINEIPNADFEIWGEHKFIYLPTDNGQIYNIDINGTGDGTFTIKSQDILNNQAGSTEVFSNLPVTAELTGQINLVGGATTLSLKQDPNEAPVTVLPSAVLNAVQSDDLLPPTSAATISGTVGRPGFYRSDISVNIKATDDLSGVLDIEYNLDNAGYQKIADGSTDIIVLGEGSHTITFFSTDKAGNNETEQTITFTIDKTPPEAIIEFDPSIKDLKFTGADNISEASLVTIIDKDNIITLTDQAGNTTEITLKDRNRKIFMRAEIKSLKYNGISAEISKNSMAFLWIYDKKKNLKTLSQHVETKKGYNILAIYNGKKTTFLGRDAHGRIKKTFDGLKIIKVTTNKGDLSWSY
jgi:pimeloyl-ACP methyl ester carboxylesterase